VSAATDQIEHDAWKQEKDHAAAYLEAMMPEVFLHTDDTLEHEKALMWGYQMAIETLEGR
jgi:hypothetical protein